MWLTRILETHRQLGRKDGPAISDFKGVITSSAHLNSLFHESLNELYEEDSTLFPVTIKESSLIVERYQVYRSFRRSSDTQALNKKVASSDIDIVNRWKTQENTRGGKVGGSMRQHYAQFELLLGPFLRYTYEM